MSRQPPCFVVLVALLLTLAGCVGGRATTQRGAALVIGAAQEPDTLDAHQTTRAISSDIMCLIGGSLLALDPEGQIVPYLAERWETSEDGLVWTFHLKPEIHFHDGTPLRAEDFVYTFERALDPETGIGAAGSLLGPLERVEAPDDATLVLTLAEPFFPLLTNLTACGYLMPLSRAAVEAAGATYGRQPMSVGPYRLASWGNGSLRLERNPSYTWGPAFTEAAPYALDAIEYRFLPDDSTRLAALEAGELDIAQIPARDIATVEGTGRFTLHAAPLTGAAPLGFFNAGKPPFDERLVRQAFNLAVDRPTLIQAVTQGHGEIQYGPISRSVLGYWPGVEELAYDFDLDAARALLAEAGYVPGPDGILANDAGRLSVPLLVTEPYTRDAEVLQAQFRELGAEVTIEVVDSATFGEQLATGAHTLALLQIIYQDADILYLLFHSTNAILPLNRAGDMELDTLLEQTRATTDPQARQQWVNEAQARIVEQAYALTLYTPVVYTAVSQRVQGLIVSPRGDFFYHGATLSADAP